MGIKKAFCDTITVFFRSKFSWILLFVPLLLLVLLFVQTSKRPESLIGTISMPTSSFFPSGGVDPFRKEPPVGLPAPATAIAYSPNGEDLFCSANGVVFKWAPDKKKWRFFSGDSSGIMGGLTSESTLMSQNSPRQLVFTPDSQRVIASGIVNARSANVYDVESRRYLGILRSTGTADVLFSKDGCWAAWAELNAVALFDLRQVSLDKRMEVDWYESSVMRKHRGYQIFVTPGEVTALSFSPDSSSLVVGANGKVFLFDVGAKFKPRIQCDLQGGLEPISGPYMGGGTSQTPNPNPLRLAWSPNGEKIAVLCADEVMLFDSKLQKVASQKVPLWVPSSSVGASSGSTMPVPGQPRPLIRINVAGLAWTPDSNTLFSTGDVVRRWRGSDLKRQGSFGLTGPIAVSPDGHWLVTANNPKIGEPYGLLKWSID